jgi:predicted RNA binding protein with dsRBD fold (UPF0201 family)
LFRKSRGPGTAGGSDAQVLVHKATTTLVAGDDTKARDTLAALDALLLRQRIKEAAREVVTEWARAGRP